MADLSRVTALETWKNTAQTTITDLSTSFRRLGNIKCVQTLSIPTNLSSSNDMGFVIRDKAGACLTNTSNWYIIFIRYRKATATLTSFTNSSSAKRGRICFCLTTTKGMTTYNSFDMYENFIESMSSRDTYHQYNSITTPLTLNYKDNNWWFPPYPETSSTTSMMHGPSYLGLFLCISGMYGDEYPKSGSFDVNVDVDFYGISVS